MGQALVIAGLFSVVFGQFCFGLKYSLTTILRRLEITKVSQDRTWLKVN